MGKCFCHFNGYEVKDAKARNEINGVYNALKQVEDTDKSLETRINDVQTEINSLKSGSPLVANSVEEMTDTTKTYVNITDGQWYYHNGTSWVAGGTYQASVDSDSVTNLDTDVKNLINNNYKTLDNNKVEIKTIPFEQGRWITTDDNKTDREIGASESVTSIRIRSTQVLKFDKNVKIKCTDGYLAEIKIVDSNMNILRNTGFISKYTVKAGEMFVITLKTVSGEVLYATNNSSYVTISCVNQIYLNSTGKLRFTSGSNNITNFNEPIILNQEEVATDIRITSEDVITKPFKLKVKEGYIVSVINRLYNGNLNTIIQDLVNTSIDYKLKNSIINIRKADNSNINPENYDEAIDIEFYDGFTFESGGTTLDENGYYEQNNGEAGLSLRIRTNPTKITKPFRITAKEGYSINLEKFDESNYRLEQIICNDSGWIKDYTCRSGIWGIAIKADDGSNINPAYINDYVNIDYDVYTYNSRPSHFKNMNVLFIGDSITEKNYSAECNWTKLLEAQLEFNSVKNIASGGTGIIAGGTDGGWYYKLDKLDTTQYDLILIMGNMNDYSNNIFNTDSLGQFGDNSLSTEYGALKLFIEKLMNKYPLAKIGWITSTPRQYRTGDNDNQNPITTEGYLYGNNSVFEGANNAIIETCKNYSIPVLDLFHESNFRVWSTEFRDKYFYDELNSVHPNNEGNKLISGKINEFVIKNF